MSAVTVCAVLASPRTIEGPRSVSSTAVRAEAAASAYTVSSTPAGADDAVGEGCGWDDTGADDLGVDDSLMTCSLAVAAPARTWARLGRGPGSDLRGRRP